MIATEHLQFFRVRTEESQEYSAFDFSTLRDSVDSIQIVDDAIALPPFSIDLIPEPQVYSARSTDYSSKSSEGHIKPKSQSITRSLNLLPLKTVLHSCKQLPFETVRKLTSFYKCPNLGKTGIQDRAFGAMFGIIIGDSIGAYSLNKVPTVNQIQSALMMEGGGVLNLLPGEGTEEWQLNMALSEGLLAGKGHYDPDIIAGKYLEWIQSKPKDMPVLVGIALSSIRKKGRERKKILNGVIEGLGDDLVQQSWRNIKQESALGLMRVVPLVLWGLNLEDDEFQYLIQQEMKMIAPNPFSVEIALLFSKMLKTLILTGSITTAFSEASSTIASASSSELSDLWHQIHCQKEPLMSSANASNVRFPFFFALSELMNTDPNRKDRKMEYLQVLVRTLSRGFNSDMNCSIVMALLGAAFGYNNIPGYFRRRVINAEKREETTRSREYWSGRVVNIADSLLKDGPLYLDD